MIWNKSRLTLASENLPPPGYANRYLSVGASQAGREVGCMAAWGLHGTAPPPHECLDIVCRTQPLNWGVQLSNAHY